MHPSGDSFNDGYSTGTARMCPFCGLDVTLVNGLTGVHEAPREYTLGGHGAIPVHCPGSGQYPRNAASDGRPLWSGARNERFVAADKPHAVGDDDFLVIDVTRQCGQVTCYGTRVPYESVAGPIFGGDSVDSTAVDYGVSRKMALVCCWYMVQEARMSKRPTKTDLRVIDRWGDWADAAFKILAGWDTTSGPCPDPPSR
jgi:uncharacterized protein (DUF433 family)